jgi:predicted flap endonuclease-1-like 5' DNA nuclease
MQRKMDSIQFEAPNYSSEFNEIREEIKRLKSGVDAGVSETKAQGQKVIAAMPRPLQAAASESFDYKVVNNEIHAARREAQEQTDTILNALSKVERPQPMVAATPSSTGERRDYAPLLNEISSQIRPLHGIVDEIELLQQKYTDLTAKLSAASVVTDVDTRDIEDKLDHIYYLLDGFGGMSAARSPRGQQKTRVMVKKRTTKRRAQRVRKKLDDLKRIKGIGRVIERKLKSSGIRTFRDIAKWNGKDVGYFDEKLHFKGRINREKWVKQAKRLYKKAG